MLAMHLSELDNPSVGNILEERARRDSDATLLLFEDQRVTSAEFNEKANRAANGLLELGVRKGDKVCLWLPNCPEWLYLWFGMVKIGAVVVPVMPGLSGKFLRHIIDHSDAETVITHSSFLAAFDAVASRLENVKRIIVDARGSSTGTAEFPPGAVLLEQLFDSAAHAPRIDVRHPDVCYIMYTSGTTGFPKGVLGRHPPRPPKPAGPPREDPYLKPGEVIYSCYPICTWFLGPLACVILGVTYAFRRDKCIDEFWDDIRRYNAVGFIYFSDLIPSLLRQPEKESDPDNPARYCSGIMAPTDKELIDAFEKRFDLKVLEVYASTEGGTVAQNREGRAASVGQPPGWIEVRIVDSEGNEVAPYVVGEIVHRRRSGEPITVEYYKMPEESAAKTRDGWFHSDDLGYKDEDGYLYYVDRKLDVIEKSGKQVVASRIEAVVSEHPVVSECAAVGIPCGLTDDDIKLCVVCEEGKTLEPVELFAFCQERLEDHMVPRYIEFLDSFPRSSRGKVQKHKLRVEGIREETWDSHKAGFDG